MNNNNTRARACVRVRPIVERPDEGKRLVIRNEKKNLVVARTAEADFLDVITKRNRLALKSLTRRLVLRVRRT